MGAPGYILLIILAALQVLLPKRIAYIPFFVTILHLGNHELFSEMTPIRIIMLLGIIRALSDGSFEFKKNTKISKLFIAAACWTIFTSFFHKESLHNPFIERVGLALNLLSAYTYALCYFKSEDFLKTLPTVLTITIIPLAFLMLLENFSGKNPYFLLGANRLYSGTRLSGAIRSVGPFGHAIISGTVGACILPIVFLVRRQSVLLFTTGIVSCLIITITSQSSGPLAALGVSIFFLCFWKFRTQLHNLKVLTLTTLIALHLYMTNGVWFIFAKIDLVGGSTGYHRSYLIDAAIKYFNEWWFAGTDYTRHWMWSGVSWNPNHTDITNYYLQFGVLSGFPMMLIIISIIYLALKKIEKNLPKLKERGNDEEFFFWCIWICIISQCVSFISIAYFDQTYALFFGLIGMTHFSTTLANKTEQN